MILERLKRETADLHLSTEAAMPFGDPAFGRRDYVQLLRRTHGFFQTWESTALQAAEPTLVRLLRERLRLPALTRDLAFFGERDASESMPTSFLPDVSTSAGMLGAMYVIEGSTLGGQFIARMLESRLGLSHGQGYSFFVGADAATGARWKAFGAHLSGWSMAHPEADDSIVAAAGKTFEAYASWVGAPVEEGRLAR